MALTAEAVAARRDHVDVAVRAVTDGVPEQERPLGGLALPGKALPGAVPTLPGRSSPRLSTGCEGRHRASTSRPSEPEGTVP